MQVKTCCLALGLAICGALNAYAQTMTTDAYIAQYKSVAMAEMRRSGVPACIKLAQGILETQSGNGWLVLNSNNHFGIKCKNNWTGQTVNYDDDEKQECFRKYGSAGDSWKDHSDFLRNNPRYRFLFDLNPQDYKAWAYGLKTAGYATSRTYPQQLIQIIERYNLTQFDQLAMSNEPLPETPGKDIAVYEPPRTTAPSKPAVAYKPVAKTNYPVNTVFKINGRKVIFVEEGTAPIQIANDKNIRLSTLLKYNDLPGDAPLEKDMLIFLQSKSKRGQNDYHVVADGESLHDIAQAEGVQLRWLRKRNKLQEGEDPAAGERVALDGYASAKPKLGRVTPVVKEDEEHKDLDPKQLIRDVKEEVAKIRNGSGGTASTGAPQAEAPAPRNNAPVYERKDTPAPANESSRSNVPVYEQPRNTAPAPAAQPARSNGIPPSMVEDLQKAGGQVTPAGTRYHTVGEKETLYAISRRYNVSVTQLQQWNNLQDNGIRIGQQLIIRK